MATDRGARLSTTARLFLGLGSVSALLAVALGAFGAHALHGRTPAELLPLYQVGVQYHLVHALGVLVVGLVAVQLPASGLVKWAGWLMLAGTLLFSGSLYLLAMSGMRILGIVTPFGGVAFLGAWGVLAIAVFKAR
jgi:uncharacterized membrane protein YgdD (TMEM256/DUF423 family)